MVLVLELVLVLVVLVLDVLELEVLLDVDVVELVVLVDVVIGYGALDPAGDWAARLAGKSKNSFARSCRKAAPIASDRMRYGPSIRCAPAWPGLHLELPNE